MTTAKVYIRNSKISFPSFIKGMKTKILSSSNELVGFLYCRLAYTGRRHHQGGNSWELYYIETTENFMVVEYDTSTNENSERHSIRFGRSYGSDMGVVFRKLVRDRIILPNGFYTEPIWENIPVHFEFDFPSSTLEVKKIYEEKLAFHHHYDDEAKLDTLTEDEAREILKNEELSYKFLVGEITELP